MPNPLTGEFEVVVQVSGRTVNRLLASLHRNAYVNPGQPTALSRVSLRLGDEGFTEAVDGVRGSVWAQVGVPSVELIHEARAEVWVAASVRAYFRADPGSASFPEFVHGQVRAKYWLATFFGGTYGAGYIVFLWPIVDPKSITFTSYGNTSADAQITAQVRAAVARRLPVTPHQLVDNFTAGRFKSLVAANGDAAVAHGLGWDWQGPPGDIGTVHEVFLDWRDLAVAVSREYVLSQIQPSIDALKTTPIPPFPVVAKPFIGPSSRRTTPSR